MILEEQKLVQRQKEAGQRARGAAADGVEGDVPPPSEEDYGAVPVFDDAALMAQDQTARLEEPYLAPCERDLLKFILEEGCTMLEFDRDSRFYMEGEAVNVAEFIDGCLADDDASFVNTAYRKVYDEYFRLYDEGLSQQQIQARLLNSMDQSMADVSRELLIEKYQITVKNYEQSLTAVSTRLVQYIPKTLMTYQCKKVELILRQLTSELAATTDPDRQVEIMEKMGDYNRARTRLNNELGRV